ncbi:Imm1 family immunity protein [Kribbella sp. NPDC056951]|uniref:Imm1 family immunity protein n=1 Tax=Kribbella sp. NPDC056951 TaxID=3345978 RepID=UPI0036438A9D
MSYSAEAYFQNEEPTIVTSADGVDELIDALLDAGPQRSVAVLAVRGRPTSELGLPDHEFEIAVDSRRQVGGLRYAGSHSDESGVWYAVGAQSGPDRLIYAHVGDESPFPADSELPIDVVRAAVKEFLSGGGERPSSVDWQQWPSDLR